MPISAPGLLERAFADHDEPMLVGLGEFSRGGHEMVGALVRGDCADERNDGYVTVHPTRPRGEVLAIDALVVNWGRDDGNPARRASPARYSLTASARLLNRPARATLRRFHLATGRRSRFNAAKTSAPCRVVISGTADRDATAVAGLDHVAKC